MKENRPETPELLITELQTKGIKHNAADIIRIARRQDGVIAFLEKGHPNAGLQHILLKHKDDFANTGISESQIPDLIITAATAGQIAGYQGRGRPVYEVIFHGKTYYIAIEIGSNGFIVSANPRTDRGRSSP